MSNISKREKWIYWGHVLLLVLAIIQLSLPIALEALKIFLACRNL